MKKGFTLIELLAVIVILAIIALIAIPSLTKVVSNVRLKADLESVRGYLNAAENYYMKAEFKEDVYNTLGTNVIDKLDIKGTKLDGSVIINNEGKVQLSIVKNKRCYKKEFNSSDIEVLEEGQCGSIPTKTVSQAGQLHVCGRYLCDKNNNTVRLKGISGGGVIELKDLYNDSVPPIRGEVNVNSFNTIKSWGANVYRIFAVASTPTMASYIGNEDQYLKRMKTLIDYAIEADMYVIVNWDPCRNNGATFTDNAVDFFTRISSMYKNDPHIIYEIWNEPENNNTWAQIKAHADKTIPAIRKNSPNAVIIVGTPAFDTKIDEAIENKLNYPNLMYTHHMYMSALSDDSRYRIERAYNAGIAIFATEWGSMGLAVDDPMVMKPESKAYISLLNKYGISNLSFAFSSSPDVGSSRYGIVLRGNWRDDLPDSILKENGKFYKSVLQGGTGDFKANLMKGYAHENDKDDYRLDEWREKIVSIKFKTTLSIPKDAVKTWDLSFAGDKSIIGYLTKTSEKDRYDMTIAADGVISAPKDSKYLFADLTNLKSIDFTNFDTSRTIIISAMFKGDSSLETLDLSMLDSSRIYMMWNTFAGCSKLKSINFNNWSPKITSWGSTFSNCQSLTELDLSNFDLSGAKNFSGIFYNNKSLKKLNISSWNPTTTTSLVKMFTSCSNLEEVNMPNFDISESADVTQALYNVKTNAKFIVKNQAVIDKLSPTANNNVNFEIKK